MKNTFIFVLMVVFAGIALGGCSPTYVNMPDLTLAEKSYPKPTTVSSLSFALAQPSILVKTEMTRFSNSGVIDRIKNDTNRVSCYLTGEVQKIILSKGFTITDTFQSYNDMTFTQKRNTSALFYPEISIEINEKSELKTVSAPFYKKHRVDGQLQITAKVDIVMLEPLSGEKLWVKSLPIGNIDELVNYYPAMYRGSQLNGYMVPVNLQFMADKVDKLFEQISEDVLVATNKYVERSEFEFLNSDIEKLKQIKRY